MRTSARYLAQQLEDSRRAIAEAVRPARSAAYAIAREMQSFEERREAVIKSMVAPLEKQREALIKSMAITTPIVPRFSLYTTIPTPTRAARAVPEPEISCPCSDSECELPDRGETRPASVPTYRREMFWQE